MGNNIVRVREFLYAFEQKFLYLHSLKLATCSLYKWTATASFQWCLERKGTFFDCCEVHIAGTMAEGERARKGGGIDAPFSNIAQRNWAFSVLNRLLCYSHIGL